MSVFDPKEHEVYKREFMADVLEWAIGKGDLRKLAAKVRARKIAPPDSPSCRDEAWHRLSSADGIPKRKIPSSEDGC